jgi:hypothetical protein
MDFDGGTCDGDDLVSECAFPSHSLAVEPLTLGLSSCSFRLCVFGFDYGGFFFPLFISLQLLRFLPLFFPLHISLSRLALSCESPLIYFLVLSVLVSILHVFLLLVSLTVVSLLLVALLPCAFAF